MKNLGGWSRLWLVFAGLWISITSMLFFLNYPNPRSPDVLLSNKIGSFWALSMSEARELLELRIEFPDLPDNNSDQHQLASQLISATLDHDRFNLEIEHQAFVTVLGGANQLTSLSEANKPAIATLTVMSPANDSAFKNQLVRKFSSQPDSWIQSTAEKLTTEAKEIENRWPKRLSESLKADTRLARNFLIGAGFFIFVPPILLILAIFLIRWVYQGFKSSQREN